MTKYIALLLLCLFNCFCNDKNADKIRNETKHDNNQVIKNNDIKKHGKNKLVSEITDDIIISLDSFYIDRTKVYIYQYWDCKLEEEGHLENYIYSKYDTLDIRKYIKDRGHNRNNLRIYLPKKKYNSDFVKLHIWLVGSCGNNSPYLVMRIKTQNKLFKVIELYEFDPETKTKTYLQK